MRMYGIMYIQCDFDGQVWSTAPLCKTKQQEHLSKLFRKRKKKKEDTNRSQFPQLNQTAEKIFTHPLLEAKNHVC